MTCQKYSITEVQDLLSNVNNAIVFINSGVPEHCLDDKAVMRELLSFIEDGVARANSLLTIISEQSK